MAKSETKVTRIKANDKPSAKVPVTKKVVKKPSKSKESIDNDNEKPKRRNPLVAIRDYFAGAWYELRQVRWPNRRSAWVMTGALVVFTSIFTLFIALLDAGFKYLFQKMLG